jgi:hypothetical protein
LATKCLGPLAVLLVSLTFNGVIQKPIKIRAYPMWVNKQEQ